MIIEINGRDTGASHMLRNPGGAEGQHVLHGPYFKKREACQRLALVYAK
jgi:hypothetical protein